MSRGCCKKKDPPTDRRTWPGCCGHCGEPLHGFKPDGSSILRGWCSKSNCAGNKEACPEGQLWVRSS